MSKIIFNNQFDASGLKGALTGTDLDVSLGLYQCKACKACYHTGSFQALAAENNGQCVSCASRSFTPITTSPSVGYIGFAMVDEKNNLILELGGASFSSQARFENEWDRIPEFEGHTAFVADCKDSDGSLIDDKNVSVDTITARLGQPIDQLIAKARKQAIKDNAE